MFNFSKLAKTSAAVTAALALGFSTLVGAAPASASTPAVPVLTLPEGDITVSGGFDRMSLTYYVCNTALIFGDNPRIYDTTSVAPWNSPGGYFYPTFEGNGVEIGVGAITASKCFIFGSLISTDKFLVSLQKVRANNNEVPYDPATHGTHVVAHVTSFAGSGSSPSLGMLSDSVEYSPPPPPAAVTFSQQPSFQLAADGLISNFSSGTWSVGSGYTEDSTQRRASLLACDASKTAVSDPSTTDLLGGCIFLMSSNAGFNFYNSPPSSIADAQTFGFGGPVNFDPEDVHADYQHIVAFTRLSLTPTGGGSTVFYAVRSASQSLTSNDSSGVTDGSGVTADVARMVPFTGPTLNTPAIPSSVKPGSALTLSGSNLSGVSRVEIGGLNAEVKVTAAGELEIVVPSGLAAGVYDLVLTSSEGRVTVQGALTVAEAVGEARPSTRRYTEDSVKTYVYDVVGAGKVQILLNGKEVAWVNASDAADRKLRDGSFVRTLNLEPGKNVIEVLVDGVQVRRTVYSN
jgi:hypothetical protein